MIKTRDYLSKLLESYDRKIRSYAYQEIFATLIKDFTTIDKYENARIIKSCFAEQYGDKLWDGRFSASVWKKIFKNEDESESSSYEDTRHIISPFTSAQRDNIVLNIMIKDHRHFSAYYEEALTKFKGFFELYGLAMDEVSQLTQEHLSKNVMPLIIKKVEKEIKKITKAR